MARKLLLSNAESAKSAARQGFPDIAVPLESEIVQRRIEMRHPATQALYAYWNEVRGDRIAPRRLEIQPARLGGLLLDTFILERSDMRTFHFRLTGTRVSQRFGMDLRALDFLDCWRLQDRPMLEHHLTAVCEHGCVGIFTAETDRIGTLAADAPLTFEVVVLPLIHTGSAIDRFLCALLPLDRTDRYLTSRLSTLRLVAAEVHWPDGEPEPDRYSKEVIAAHVRKARIVHQGRRQFRVYEGGRSEAVHEKL